MKPEEIRIGNWVRHYAEWSNRQPNNGPFEEFDFQWEDCDWYWTGESCMEVEKIKPIPITTEWLEKFGWVWNEECKSYEKYPDGDARMHLSLKMGGSYTMFNYVLKAVIAERIYYVHQLQNLYWCLCGKELTMKKETISKL